MEKFEFGFFADAESFGSKEDRKSVSSASGKGVDNVEEL